MTSSMKQLAFSLILILSLAGCSNRKIDTTGLAARVGDRFLTMDEVLLNIPPGVTGADSVKIAKNYVNNWVEEQSVTLMAERLIPDTKEIDRMVEEYRRQLLMWEYRRHMTLQNAGDEPEDEDIAQYYENHKSLLKLQRPIIRGIYIKIPDNARENNEIKKLYRSDKTDDMDKLEKLMDHAVNYEYFRDKWVDWSIIESRIPAKELDADPDNFPLNNDHLEVTSDGYTYYLQITDNLKAGDTMPLDYARDYIIDALQRENAVSYDKTLRKQLFDRAYRDGIAQIYIE